MQRWIARGLVGGLCWGVVLALAACGSVENGDDGGGSFDAADSDGGGDAGGAPDAAAPRCNPTTAFSPAMALTTINGDGSDEGAHLSADELTLYFSSSREGGLGSFDLYAATRSNLAEMFDDVEPIPGVNTAGVERYPTVTADGLTLYALTGAGSSDSDIVVAQRSSTSAPFGPLATAAGVNGTTSDSDSYVLPDHTALYFSSDRGTATGWDLYRSSRAGGQLGAPVPVNAVDVNGPDADTTPVVSADELTLYFGSNRPGGLGNYDMYVATRASLADAFGPATGLASLNSAELEVPSWISADNCVLYFTRLESDSGTYAIYVASRGQ